MRGAARKGGPYRERLSEAAPLNGTFYEGDLDLLDGALGVSLPIAGDERKEWGFNLDALFGPLGVFFQFVDEEAASLPRQGVELELSFRFELGDTGDPNALFSVLEPVFRYARLDNDFRAPPGFVAPSLFWDWTKIDVGARVTIVSNVDLTFEYAFHDIDASKDIGHDEFLTTLRFRFP